MSESSRQAIVVPIQLVKHPDADSLSIVSIDGFTVVVNTQAWEGHTTAVYCQPQTIVNVTRPEFAFLKREDKNRDEEVITVRKFRGIWSQGLLVPTPEGFNIGDDCWEFLGLRHYEPEEEVEGLISGHTVPGPIHWKSLPKYDVENIKKYGYLFRDGELVNVSEKYHGANMSCVYSDGKFHVKSRNLWKEEDENGHFWRSLRANPSLSSFLEKNPDYLIQGEMCGNVKGFTYGLKTGDVVFKAFDIRKPDYSYMDVEEFVNVCDENNITRVSSVGQSLLIPYDKSVIDSLTDGKTTEGEGHIREGVVVRPQFNRYESRLNSRLILKSVSNAYLEKTGKK